VRQIPNPGSVELLGGEVGILILRGFGSSPEPVAAWADALHQMGHTVFVPHFSGAAHRWQDLSGRAWRQWEESAESEFHKLKIRCEKVFLASFEVGGALALYLAEVLGDEIEGLILLEPSLPIHSRVFPKSWHAIELDLDLVDQPVLLIYLPRDRVDESKNVFTIINTVSSPFIREVHLEVSFNSVADHDFPLLIDETVAFISEVASGVWLADIGIENDEADLIDAEFQSIVAGLSLDEASPSNYLDDLDSDLPDDHFEIPDPKLLPISDRTKRNSIVAMILGPIYAVMAAITSFNPLGVEPWPGVLAFLSGLAVFLYRLRDDYRDDDGAIV
jgi:carboxylesterase